jgi:glycosyltransferase involved in cell wall biosynthesis
MKINWFSPVPPAKTGIADYTLGLLPALSKEAEVVLWTNQANRDRALEQYATVRQYEPEQMDWVEFNRANLSFYHIGNNHRFHTSIWQVSSRAPGIVILHDVRLHDFFESLYRGHWRDERGYLAQMEKHYGDEGLKTAAQFVSADRPDYDAMAQRFSMIPLVLENALGAMVHTRDAFNELQKSKRWPVVYAPLPFTNPVAPSFAMNGRPGEPYRLIIFGHIGRNRRLSAVLEALSQLAEKDRFHLDIYGEMDDAKSVRQRIQGLNLKHLVTVHGYAPASELDHALQAASLAINLRYPTMGEASASQLRIWEHALPSLVTKVGWYGSLSEETVAHVRPDNEVEDIRAHLAAFLQDPERFAHIGREGRRFLEQEHDQNKYVQAVVSLASSTRELNLGKAACDLARRAGEKMGSWNKENGDPPQRVAERILQLCGS